MSEPSQAAIEAAKTKFKEKFGMADEAVIGEWLLEVIRASHAIDLADLTRKLSEAEMMAENYKDASDCFSRKLGEAERELAAGKAREEKLREEAVDCIGILLNILHESKSRREYYGVIARTIYTRLKEPLLARLKEPS